MKIQDYEAIFEDLPRLQDDWKKVLLGKKQAYTGGASFAVFGLIPESKRKLALSPIMLTKAQKNKVCSCSSTVWVTNIEYINEYGSPSRTRKFEYINEYGSVHKQVRDGGSTGDWYISAQEYFATWTFRHWEFLAPYKAIWTLFWHLCRNVSVTIWPCAKTAPCRNIQVPKSPYEEKFTCRIVYSMTQLLSHTFAHLTGPSFRLKVKLLPNINLHKSCWKLQNSDFQSQFFTSKIIRIFLFFFHWRISI